MARIIINLRAERDLKEIYDYISDHSDEDSAAAVLRRIAESLQLQAEYPAGRRRHDELYIELRSITVRPYIVFYFPLDDGLEVMRVLHGRRDIKAAFNEESEED